jgi:hypothetical protein
MAGVHAGTTNTNTDGVHGRADGRGLRESHASDAGIAGFPGVKGYLSVRRDTAIARSGMYP